ncbi:hypothetical protein FisN_3Lh040 [Fistulifera solaris]|uniref:Calcineurin-like phosphoesterase domain-containing protein n=1 Tax=Fistulifera solaris TaxID=1519565 RepID=A0A1Z5JZB3_FISSO|nr:hypothetical protein FisN_3Lh040 [Fistulifera solaris]|eukprot:GAX19101.1 hypothetical protein FisN_3Lh040 [Fistulifera solaris]
MNENRFRNTQQGRTFRHASLPQESHSAPFEPFTFVVTADTQFGMIDQNKKDNVSDSYAEVEYSRKAIAVINEMNPRPLFCCICGDLVDMTAEIYTNTPKNKQQSKASKDGTSSTPRLWTKEECDAEQDEQFRVFQETWNELNQDIPLVCLCGNHDVGNRPNAASIDRFQKQFGDDYFAFWVRGSYNIVINSSLISQPDNAMDLYEKQLQWIKERLVYANEVNAAIIFVFSHHPLFLYDQDEDETTLPGTLTIQWPPAYVHRQNPQVKIPESYFPVPRTRRKRLLELFAKYNVAACFAGHFHQNLVRTTSFGMDMITTGPLSLVLPSDNNPFDEPFAVGFRLVHVKQENETGKCVFEHTFIPL